MEKERLLSRRELASLILGSAAGLAVSSLERPLSTEAHGDHPDKFPLSDGSGWHYIDSSIEFYSYPDGYSVRGAIWKAYEMYGQEYVWGPPISGEWTDELGRKSQAFQKGIFQVWSDGRVEWANIFDLMDKIPGRNDWLETKFIPRPQQISYPSANPTWEQIKTTHLALLETNPKIKDYYFSNPQWLEQYGLPVAVKEYQDVITIRCQRAALHQWKEELPWAKKGEITVANAAQLAKEITDGRIIPTDALVAELSERWPLHNFPFRYPDDGRRLPESIIGSDLFVKEYSRVLEFLKNNAPVEYKEILDVVYRIKESPEGAGSYASSNAVYLTTVKNEFSGEELIIESAGLYHEALHVKLRNTNFKSAYKYAELWIIKRQRDLLEKLNGPQGEIKFLTDLITNIDDPSVQWWNR